MASIFTYQEEPPRVHSPWSTPGSATPQRGGDEGHTQNGGTGSQPTTITKLEPEKQDGPTEYKLHLLLRPRRYQTASGSSNSQISGQPTEASPHSSAEGPNSRPPLHNFVQSRQARLQQLTTQLLWRLQQSSPFHSSSNADLVLPLLPEATPRLGVPERPAKLLPGLEESQGALYEIGVADDGTLVGLVEEELEESLNNLRAMAASLGCVVDILRRVLIADHEPKAAATQTDQREKRPVRIYVAEVLVKPDTKSPHVPLLEERAATEAFSQSNQGAEETRNAAMSPVEQLRIAVTGATTAGKSSLVGTLTTSTLDNGRGKSRLSLLKHRHEIASGITSSVAQELLGYCKTNTLTQPVVNYASGDVSSWPDIHNLASRLIFVSDSPGLPRYAKSTFRTLISWNPTWTLLCVAADENESGNDVTGNLRQTTPLGSSPGAGVAVDSTEPSLAHLDMCLRLDLPLIVAITKMDIATKSGLRTVLSKVLSILKTAGRIPVLLSSPSNVITAQDENVDIASELMYLTDKEQAEVTAVVERINNAPEKKIVPIVLSSAVTGAGIGKLHGLLKDIGQTGILSQENALECLRYTEALFHVDEMFAIPPSKVYSENKQEHSADHGIVLCGHVAKGRLAVGDRLRLGPFLVETELGSRDDAADTARSTSQSVETGRRPLPRPLSGILSKSLQGDHFKSSSLSLDPGGVFLEVQVVSLRSLRLPVRSMRIGETGTVGVQPIAQTSPVPLSRARKGMVLVSASPDNLLGYRSFEALFPTSDFTNVTSPPLILGGLAIAYVNSVRAAVKVTALAMNHDGVDTEPSSPSGMFSFDGEGDSPDDSSHYDSEVTPSGVRQREARITFRFVSSIEWMEVGSKVLIVPTVTAAGPVTGPPVAFNGLSGFVGKVSDLYT